MLFREYLASDRDACLAVFDSNVPHFFATHERAEFAAFLHQLPGPYFVLEEDGAVLACGGHAARSSSEGILCWGMVDAARHRQGIGSLLLRERLRRAFAVAELRRVTIETSQHSVGFFQKQGFTMVSVVPHGFAQDLDRCQMAIDRGRAC